MAETVTRVYSDNGHSRPRELSKGLLYEENTNELYGKNDRPVVVIFTWLYATQRQVNRYVDFYKKQGFDVLTAFTKSSQLLRPKKGTQITAANIVNFLKTEKPNNPILIHGFSMGAYLYGECLVKMKDSNGYEGVASRIRGQVFDSAGDYYLVPNAISNSVFPRSTVGQAVINSTVKCFLVMFHSVATKHYLKSSQYFHNNFVRAPALFFFSSNDRLGGPEGNLKVMDSWKNNGVSVSHHCWDQSQHVNHMRLHPDEYQLDLCTFLDGIKLLKIPHTPLTMAEKSKLV